MRAYGSDFDDCQIKFTRDGKKGRSSLIYDGHKVNFKLQDGLSMVNLQKVTEDDLNYVPAVVLTSDIIYNTKELSDHYLDQNRTGRWDPKN